MIRLRLIMNKYADKARGERDIARQQPDGLREFNNGDAIFVLTLIRGDVWRTLKQAWWLWRQPNSGPPLS